MEVIRTVEIDDVHRIEVGRSSWDSNVISVRNRYDNVEGKFNHAGSSEVSMRDLTYMVVNGAECFETHEITGMLWTLTTVLHDRSRVALPSLTSEAAVDE